MWRKSVNQGGMANDMINYVIYTAANTLFAKILCNYVELRPLSEYGT